MKSKIIRFVSTILAIQLSGFPMVALAAGNDLSPQDIRVKAESNFQKAENQGWSFLDANKKETHVTDMFTSVLSHHEFYAVSPYVNDLKARLTIKVQLDAPSVEKLSFRLSVLNNKGEIASARKFEVTMDPKKAEDSKLKFVRTLKSMAADLQNRTDLAVEKSRSQKILSHLTGLFMSSAQAGMPETAVMLQTVAGGACTLGFFLLIFSDKTMPTENGGTRLTTMGWLTIAAFVTGGASYIISGLVADLK